MSYSEAEAEQAVSKIELYVVVVILLILGFIGTSGNALVLYVFSSKRDGLVSTMFITVLAVVDMTTCLFIVPFTVVMELVDYNVGGSDFICKLYQFLITSNIPFSALVMAAIAVDRYLCICRPFVRILTVTRARWVVVALALFAGSLGLGGSLTHGVYRRMNLSQTLNAESDQTNDTSSVMMMMMMTTTTTQLYEGAYFDAIINGSVDLTNDDEWVIINTGNCEPTDLLLSEQFGLAFQKCYNGVFLGCLLVVSVLYGLIFRSVRQRRLWREKHKSSAAMTTITATPLTGNPSHQCHHQSSPKAEKLLAVEVPAKDSHSLSTKAEVATNNSTRSDSKQNVGGGNADKMEEPERCKFDDQVVSGEQDHPTVMSSDISEVERSQQQHKQQLGQTAKNVLTMQLSPAEDENCDHGGDVVNGSYKNNEAGDLNQTLASTSSSAAASECTAVAAAAAGIVEKMNNDNHINSRFGAALLVVVEPDKSAPPSIPYLEPTIGNGGRERRGNNGHCCGTGSNTEKTATPPFVTNIGTSGGSGGSSATAAAAAAVTGGVATSLAAAQKNRIANVKTAAMLFVVTLVFVLTFMPALSMTVQLIPYNMTVFYMYFANNVANPIIYSFMNQNFRKQLKRMFAKRQGQGSGRARNN